MKHLSTWGGGAADTNARRWGLLAVVVAGALGFRLWGITWGFPLKYAHIDESVVLFYSVRILSGAVNSGFFDYPSFFLNLLAAFLRLSQAIGYGGGLVPSLEVLLGDYVAGDSRFFLVVARGLTVMFAAGTVALTAHMGRRLGGGAGLGAAALLAGNPFHVLHSHYGTLDVAGAFLTLLAMDRIVRYGETGRERDGLWAGAAVGLAAAAKYYPGILMVPLLGILLWRGRPRETPGARGAGALGVAAKMTLSALAAFALGSPFTLLALPDFLSRFAHLFPKIVGIPGTSLPFVPTIRHLFDGVGAWVFLFGLAGAAVSLGTRGPWRTLMIVWIALLFFLGLWRHQTAHYGLGLYPVLLMLACRGFSLLKRFHRTLPGLAWSAGMILSLVPTVREMRALVRPDTRLEAGAWLRGNLHPGAKILRFAHTPEFTPRDPFQVTVDFTNQALAWVAEGREAPALLSGYDCLVFSSFNGTADPAVAALRSRFSLVRSFSREGGRFPHNPSVFVFATHG